MGVKDGFMGAPIMMKVALILLLVANLFSWIAFTTTSWGYYDANAAASRTGSGLWRTCAETVGCSRTDGTRLDWYAAFQAFGIFGYVGLNIATLLVILSMFVGSCKGNGEVNMGAIISCFVGAVCWLISVIIFAAEWPDWADQPNVDEEFGFSFALAIVSLIIAIIAGILLIVGGKGGGTSPA